MALLRHDRNQSANRAAGKQGWIAGSIVISPDLKFARLIRPSGANQTDGTRR
jgi:hypothetical protein